MVKVSAKGVVLHSHEGWSEFHDPNRAHAKTTELHDSLGDALAKPDGFSKLTIAEKAQFKDALRTASHAGKTHWVYGEKKVAVVAPALVAPTPIKRAPKAKVVKTVKVETPKVNDEAPATPDALAQLALSVNGGRIAVGASV